MSMSASCIPLLIDGGADVNALSKNALLSIGHLNTIVYASIADQ